MRELTSTLLAAQKQATAVPYIKVEVTNKIVGVVRYDWERVYNGTEEDYLHALTLPGDGSLIRVRVTPPTDAQKLYRQRVSNPGPESDFSQWTDTGQYNVVAVAAASLGAEVSIFWIKTNREIRRIKSTDNGVNWGSPELIGYSPTTAINGMAAAYKTTGDLAIFYADQSTLYVRKNISGQWQSPSAWDKSTGNLSGAACVYDADWNLLVTGLDTSGNYRLWSLVYGDGSDVDAGSWSDLKEIAAAPSGGDFEFRQPFLDKPDSYRCFFTEKFTGTEVYNRPFWSHSIPDTGFIDNLWREPVPFNLSSEYGLAIVHHGDYAWLSNNFGVWTAGLAVESLDLTADVTGLKCDNGLNSGRLTVELRNDDGRYAAPGEGDLSVLDIGCEIEVSPGYVTGAGNEYSDGLCYSIESREHASSGGKANFTLKARDGWSALEDWKAKYQFRWNKTSEDMSVKDIMAFILARAGLKLEVISQSSSVTSFYPDITLSAGTDGRSVVQKLLSFVPDVLFIEGNTAYLVNPVSSDTSIYGYGGGHVLLEGRYRRDAQGINRVQVEGYDSGGAEVVITDSFSWDEVDVVYDRLKQVEDRNIGTVAEAQQRGQAILRQSEIEAVDGSILVPVNCGQQLFDVIDVTDGRAGLVAEKKRVLGISLEFHPVRGEYAQRLRLGAV
jgi:hypothetical protein